jgi:hypothetical protein
MSDRSGLSRSRPRGQGHRSCRSRSTAASITDTEETARIAALARLCGPFSLVVAGPGFEPG